jgi:transcriptional regulator with XRE-family HTH domain
MRLSQNLSIDKLAEKVGVTTGYLSHCERGLRSPSFPLLTRVAAALEIPVTYFFFIHEMDNLRTNFPEFYEAALAAEPKLRAYVDRYNVPVEQLSLFEEVQ